MSVLTSEAEATERILPGGVRYRRIPVTPTVAYGIGRRGRFVHRIDTVTAVFRDDDLRFRVQWVCPVEASNPILLTEPGNRQQCGHCASLWQPVVYRVFDATGFLLYIGATCYYDRRMRQHAQRSPWWKHVEYIDRVECASAAEAFAAETEAIGSEDPAWNRRGRRAAVPTVRRRSRALDYLDRDKFQRLLTSVPASEVALVIGRDEVYVHQMAAGIKHPRPYLMPLLATALGCDVLDLMPDDLAA